MYNAFPMKVVTSVYLYPFNQDNYIQISFNTVLNTEVGENTRLRDIILCIVG